MIGLGVGLIGSAGPPGPGVPLLGGIEPTLYLNFADRSYGVRALEAQDYRLGDVEPSLVMDFSNSQFGCRALEAQDYRLGGVTAGLIADFTNRTFGA